MKKVVIVVALTLILIFSFHSLAMASPVSPGKDITKYTFVHKKLSGKLSTTRKHNNQLLSLQRGSKVG